jgi:hydrogenase nickel incorporation protein HypA/HybF
MHELSIALSLLQSVCDHLPRLGAVTVRAVRVRVGSLSGVSPDALLFAFDVACDLSPIAGARLEVERTQGSELELTALEVLDEAADCRSSTEHPEEE